MRTIAIEWQADRVEGTVKVTNGCLARLTPDRGEGAVEGCGFTLHGGSGCRLLATVEGENLSWGANPTMVTVCAGMHPFTFLLRDVSAAYPIWLPALGVVVAEEADTRTYAEIAEALRARGTQTHLQRIETEPEETWDQAAAATRSLQCPTWLGISRDIRLFEVGVNRETADFAVKPRLHGPGVKLPELDDREAECHFAYGRGAGCVETLVERRLEDGVLPILHTTVDDDEVKYYGTAFATLERSPLTAETLRGTHYLVADGHGFGHMFTEEQQAEYDRLLPEELGREEETVLFWRVQAVNTGVVPRYAWFRAPSCSPAFDGERGFALFASGRVYALALLDGEPLPQAEVAVLLPPGKSVSFEFRIPHRPISAERAEALARQSFADRHAECAAFWREKLCHGAQISVPEPRIDEMIRAGRLHLDLVAYGLEPEGTVAATIGVYCPIGSESSPIIQYLDSLGWHDLARRALQYFLDKQHEDGFMQNFGGYMLETGAALWSFGEHFRYTHDEAWARQVAPQLLRSCDFLLAWRGRNKREELRGRGYGLIEGKVGDPEDPYRNFMLNGYAYLGLARVAEMLAAVGHAEATRLAREAEAWRSDIRTALAESEAKSPVIPLGDGTWCPAAGPWAEARGAVALLTDGNRWWTHGTFLARDSMIGALYLILQEVLAPDEAAADRILAVNGDLYLLRNVGFSQPFYCRHPYAHLRRGEVRAFLKEFYNGLASLADRETYTWWEHYFHASPHKTHEEAWWLLQTRGMLYLEEGETLRLLAGIPRAWLEQGKVIEVRDAASYFGRISLRVVSEVEQGRITAQVECEGDRKPRRVVIRLPHPRELRAMQTSGGVYDPQTETVTIEPWHGQAEVVAEFA
jgi:hypothetical protein